MDAVMLPGGHRVEVVGESHYDAALEKVSGGRTEDGHDFGCTAYLVAEPSNPYDPNAVAVYIGDHQVGHLSRQAAQTFQPVAERLAGRNAACRARVSGGWDRGGNDRGYYGVVLDLAGIEECLDALGGTTPAHQPPHQASLRAKGMNGTIIFDGQMVTLERKGFNARVTVGKGTKSIPIGNVTAVQWKPAGLTAGVLSLTLAGGVEMRSRFGHQAGAGRTDENSVTFHKRQEPEFEKVRDAIQHAITTPSPQATQAAQGPPPGWYANPDGASGQRWWDGTRWTEHTQP